MEAPPSSSTDPRLSFAIEANLFELLRAIGHLPGAELHEDPELCRHFAPPYSPMFKGAWGARIAPGEEDRVIAATVSYFRARGAPFFFWWTRAEPSTLGARLEANGLVPFELNSPGMVGHLADLDYEALDSPPPGFALERVRDAAGLRTFAHTFVTCYGIPEWAGSAWTEATLSMGIENAPWNFYVASFNGRPVAVSMGFHGAGVASVYAVGVLREARRQGFGAAVTLAPFYDALERGLRYGVLFSTDEGMPMYQRLGFRRTDFAISRFLWQRVD
jgi:GNAT superfamily N-acetyltransferase